MPAVRLSVRRIAPPATFGVVAVLALGQLLLPHLAANRLRDRLGRYGSVASVSVAAFPAVELLWGDASSADVRTGRLRMSLAQASSLLWEARGVASLDLAADAVKVGPFALGRLTVAKRGANVHVGALVTESALRSALPGTLSVVPVGSSPDGVLLRARGNFLGGLRTVSVLVRASSGRLVAVPVGLPGAAASLHLTLVALPHLYVTRVSLVPAASSGAAADASYHLSVAATLR